MMLAGTACVSQEFSLKKAKKGKTQAQYNLGVRLAEGQGLPKSEEEAVGWYRKAAKKGHAKAQNNLGVMYNEGRGVFEDHKKALHWFHLSAEKGFCSSAS